MEDWYNFFGVEIDYKTHESRISDRKDDEKDKTFKKLGIPIYRIRLEKIIGDNKWDLSTIEDDIWKFTISDKIWGPLLYENRDLAIKLKENQLTKCRNKKCGHKAYEHSLSGCNFRLSTKKSDYCNCSEPFLVSDM